MEDYKKLLTDLYTTHDPERVKQVDYFLERYKGKEKQFLISQRAKYKSKKPVSDSKKIIEEALARIKSQSTEKGKTEKEKKETTPKKTDSKPTEKKAEPVKDIKKAPVSPVAEKKITAEIKAEPKKEIEPVKEKKAEVTEAKKEIKKEVTSPQKTQSKDDVWFDKESKKAIPEPQVSKPIATPSKPDKHFNKKYFLYIFGSVLLVIILTVIVFFIFFYSPSIKKDDKTVEKPKTTITEKQVKAEPKKTTAAEENKITQQKEKPPVKASSKKQTVTNLSGVHIKKGDISLPAYFVACSAVKSENFALKKVSELKASGFDASYYWIPDFVSYGSPYFKVVIGPFSTRMEAMKKLTPVQERAEFDAYVLELK